MRPIAAISVLLAATGLAAASPADHAEAFLLDAAARAPFLPVRGELLSHVEQAELLRPASSASPRHRFAPDARRIAVRRAVRTAPPPTLHRGFGARSGAAIAPPSPALLTLLGLAVLAVFATRPDAPRPRRTARRRRVA